MPKRNAKLPYYGQRKVVKAADVLARQDAIARLTGESMTNTEEQLVGDLLHGTWNDVAYDLEAGMEGKRLTLAIVVETVLDADRLEDRCKERVYAKGGGATEEARVAAVKAFRRLDYKKQESFAKRVLKGVV